MKKNIHPKNYRIVVFKDISNNNTFICRSTIQTKSTIKINNIEYPLYKLDISSYSHPFFTGKMKYVDTAGRIEKFFKKYKK
ncbi:MAG: type B 50S ribosomal protein L31 [Candidatus Bostrichicola ureolyticus]|nr:MAG: type B 50S ribosomal protein L31 [Candidatus Bostrichicola ureolyticus]WGH27784.1 MAG: type B 50S ribosomal protein L31 [Candidatus Bostrichicola ureolyticus]